MNIGDLKNIPLWPDKQRLIAILAMCAAAFALIYYFEISYVIDKLTASSTEEKNLKQQFEDAVAKQTKLETELSSYADIKNQYDDWQKNFVSDDGLLDLLNEILKIGAKNKLSFNNFDPGEQSTEGAFGKMPIYIKVVGTYHDLSSFMSQIANLPWIVVIRKFTISRVADTTDKSSLNTELILEIYKKTGTIANAV